MPKQVAFAAAPELTAKTLNPHVDLDFLIVSHDERSTPILRYYNSRLAGTGTRDEARMTRFGGTDSALQTPDNTGALLLVAFRKGTNQVLAWLASGPDEETILEDTLAPVLPGELVSRIQDASGKPVVLEELPGVDRCSPPMKELPPEWKIAFPAGQELTEEAARRAGQGLDADARLVQRYRCEFGIFKVVEQAHVLPLVISGFNSVDAFLGVAQSVAQRRKARAGRSLELHVRRIFDEERVRYSFHAETEGGRIPDFVFPSIERYDIAAPSSPDLRMLAVKTTLKDRWRQVLDEAAKIREKHLLTLAEGVSVGQFSQIAEGNITLIVPSGNFTKFPTAVRPHLLSLQSFIGLVRTAH